jgi:chromosome partitioning protein
MASVNIQQRSVKFMFVHTRLMQEIPSISNKFDIIFIDCPPNFNLVTKNAVLCSKYILIPVKADYLSVIGIQYLQKNLNDLKNIYNMYAKLFKKIPSIEFNILGAVFTMIQFKDNKPIMTQDIYIQELINKKSVPVFTSMIRKNDSIFPSAPEDGVPVSCANYPDKTYKQIVTELDNLTIEFKARIGI